MSGPSSTSTKPHAATLKRINMRRFLDELRRRGPSTRADLTRAVGVTPPTSSSVIADLMATGYLEEVSGPAGSRGRPGKVFRLASQRAYVIGVTIDIRECQMNVGGLDGRPAESEPARFATPRTYDSLLELVVTAVSALRRDRSGECQGVGLAVPGLVDESRGVVAFSPNLHFLDGRRLGPDLAQRLGCEVTLTQEEHALCLCEQHTGLARDLSDFAVIDFSSGVGMGVVSGGHYISGHKGFAGEIGHTTVVPGGLPCGCGNRGCLETVASDTALARMVSCRLERDVSVEELPELCKDEELDTVLEFISIGIATVVNLFNPSAVFVNGKLFTLQPDVLTRVGDRVRSHALRPSTADLVMMPASGNKMEGAMTGLLDRLFESVGPRLS